MLTLGQTWTTFADAAALPLTVDLDGPNSSVSLRSVQLRSSHRLGQRWQLAVASESPSADISRPQEQEGAEAYQNIPDVVAHARIVTARSRLQVAGVFRVLSVQDVAQKRQSFVGFGVNAIGQHALDERFVLGAQAIIGRGISRYITGFAGRGFDLVYDSTTAGYYTLDEAGGYLSLARTWSPGHVSNLILGTLWILDDGLPPDFYRVGGYFAANHYMPVAPGARVGAELVFGTRRNASGESGNAARLSAIFLYDF